MPGINKKDSIGSTKRLLVWEPSQPADAILDKTYLALAKGMLVYIGKDKMKEHQKVTGVKAIPSTRDPVAPRKLYQHMHHGCLMVS